MDSATKRLVEELHSLARSIDRPVSVMEVCGTHTVSIFRHGLRSLMPEGVRLVSGPGCPVCVTAQRHIDAAVQLGGFEDVIIATYGDMMRVPGRLGSLEACRGKGGDVRIIASARSALKLAQKHPDKRIVFVAVGFETTAPATAAVVLEAGRTGLDNFFVLTTHKLIVPAMLALLDDEDVRLDGFLCPGHVSVVIGSDAYRPVVERHRMPCVVAGFEPKGILDSLVALLRQIDGKAARLENRYEAVVTPSGNPVARQLMDEAFSVADTPWRAMGVIPQSGLELRSEFRRFDALTRFGIQLREDEDHPGCRCGDVIRGKVTPAECTLFGASCTPLNPLGPCMVSSEGTCSAWFKYKPPAHSKRS